MHNKDSSEEFPHLFQHDLFLCRYLDRTIPEKDQPDRWVQVIRRYRATGLTTYWSPEIRLDLINASGVHLQLTSLKQPAFPHNSQFEDADFYQKSFHAVDIKGAGSLFHDCLIAHRSKLPFEIRNVYSTSRIDGNNSEGDFITGDAIRFWEKRQEREKAAFITELGRFKIRWA